MVQTTTPAPRNPERDRATLAAIEAAAQTNTARAIDLAITALGDGLEHALVLHLVATGLEEDGRGDDALPLLMWARSLAPSDVAVINGLGLCFASLGRWREAVEAYDDALAINPNFIAALMNKGAAMVALKQTAGAEEAYLKAATLHPRMTEAWSSLASLAARHGDAARTRNYAEKTLALDPHLAAPQLANLQADLAERDYDAAENRAKAILRHPQLTTDQRAQTFGLLGDALDGLGRYDDAFEAYGASNAQLKSAGAELFKRGEEPAIEYARRVERYVTTAPARFWESAPDGGAGGQPDIKGHVFLMGFPRSGTTLLEQVLTGHPDLLSLEERPMLEIVAKPLMANTMLLDRLADLTPAEADAARTDYWNAAAHFAARDLSGKVVVDKNPLATLYLPVIGKLFPNAKILFARRDPRDVVLSCFRRRFRLNLSMFEFLSLEGAAEYYDAVLQLSELCLPQTPLPRMDVIHEAFVADFEARAAEVLRFIGLDWDPGVLAFATRARSANTPSAKQLARGLTSESINHWRQYHGAMAPVLPKLEPWVQRFGYEPSGPLPPGAKPRSSAALAAALEEIQQVARRRDWPTAFRLAGKALDEGLRDPMLYRLRGARLQQEGRLGEAIADFEAALASSGPDDFASLNALGLCLARFGRPEDGLARLDAALALQPGFAAAHYNRGWTLEALGEMAQAKAAYERALELDPRQAQSLGALAVLAARAAVWPEARARAVAALALDPGQAPATIALADAEAAQGEGAQAEARLRTLVQSSRVSPHERAMAWSTLGDVLDGLDRPGDAFKAYETGARGLRDLYEPGFLASGAEPASQRAERLIRHFETADPAAWRRPAARPDDEAPRHVFLVGFPRSGTTMLGQALAGHSQVITLDEKDTLADTTERFMRRDEDLDRLASIDPTEAQQLRNHYWMRVRGAGADPSTKLIVDKLPTNTLTLPVILKLFPSAKIVFLRRDPRDVVLSCFRRQFVINPTTIDLLTLPGAARLYDDVMRLMEVYSGKLDLDLRVQSYETLVGDFETQMRGLCGFIGLEWEPGMADFAGRSAVVATPSSAQLARGLSAEGIGHWRRYAHELAPVMPTLAPWVMRYGYPES